MVTVGERRCLGKLIQACSRIKDLLKMPVEEAIKKIENKKVKIKGAEIYL